jgi:hypothetical protein
MSRLARDLQLALNLLYWLRLVRTWQRASKQCAAPALDPLAECDAHLASSLIRPYCCMLICTDDVFQLLVRTYLLVRRNAPVATSERCRKL